MTMYCPLCRKEYSLDAFADHVHFPLHISAEAHWCVRVQESLSAIADLLQLLVDKSETAAIPKASDGYIDCPSCGYALPNRDAYTAHMRAIHKQDELGMSPGLR